MSLRDDLRQITRRIAPAFLAGVVLLAAGACGKNIDNAVRQLQIDQKKIAQFLDEHCLTPTGEIIPLSEVPATSSETDEGDQDPSLPEGYVVLSDTAQSRENMYIIPLKAGAGDTPAATDKVLIRYRGYHLETMQEFDSTWDDPEPLSGVGFRRYRRAAYRTAGHENRNHRPGTTRQLPFSGRSLDDPPLYPCFRPGRENLPERSPEYVCGVSGKPLCGGSSDFLIFFLLPDSFFFNPGKKGNKKFAYPRG